MEFVTRFGEEAIAWQVEISWKKRRELYCQEAVDGGVVDTVRVIQALWPPGEAPGNAVVCIRGWDRPEQLTEEALWNTNFAHLTQLCVLVGSFLYTGVVPEPSPPEDSQAGKPVPREGEEEEGEAAIPLSSESPEPPTDSSSNGAAPAAGG